MPEQLVRPEGPLVAGAAGDLLENAPCGFVAFDDAGTIVIANTTLTRMLGMGPGDLHGRSVETILTVASRIFYQTHFFPLLKLYGHADEIYLTLRSADGTPVHVLVNAVRPDASGGDARSDCILLPIHERQKYEQELLRSRKNAEEASVAKTRFLSMMSHDLRTPLGAIAGYVDILTLGVRGPLTAQQRDDLGRIKGLSQSLLNMVEDILHFARGEPQPIAVALAPVPVGRLFTEVETIVLPHVAKAGLRYERVLAEPDLTAAADQARLQRILVNLVGNAVKFTPRGGSIQLSGGAAGDLVVLRVTDSGRGIPSDRLEDIFSPFVQLAEAEAERTGVGLGLAISREFARAMGGDIGVESAPGKGSVFTVTLRAAA